MQQPPILRVKLEQNITEMIHQQIVTRELIQSGVKSSKDFRWQSQMRFTYNPKESNVLKQCQVRTANADFYYGFEYAVPPSSPSLIIFHVCIVVACVPMSSSSRSLSVDILLGTNLHFCVHS